VDTLTNSGEVDFCSGYSNILWRRRFLKWIISQTLEKEISVVDTLTYSGEGEGKDISQRRRFLQWILSPTQENEISKSVQTLFPALEKEIFRVDNLTNSGEGDFCSGYSNILWRRRRKGDFPEKEISAVDTLSPT